MVTRLKYLLEHFCLFSCVLLTKLTSDTHSSWNKKKKKLICSQIASRSVAFMSDTDMLISVSVTSNVAVGRTGHYMPLYAIQKECPSLKSCDTIFALYYFSFAAEMARFLIQTVNVPPHPDLYPDLRCFSSFGFGDRGA